MKNSLLMYCSLIKCHTFIYKRILFDFENFVDITKYYGFISATFLQAFDTALHPLGRMIIELVDVYRVTYVGLGAHPHLLPHAVQEMKSFVERLYHIVRYVFKQFHV